MHARAIAAAAAVIAAGAVVSVWWPTVATADSYTVQPGDSLGVIASRTGLSTDRLAALNAIRDPDTIYPGQILTTSEPTKYVVRSGDTLGGIAAHLGAWTTSPAARNGLGNPD